MKRFSSIALVALGLTAPSAALAAEPLPPPPPPPPSTSTPPTQGTPSTPPPSTPPPSTHAQPAPAQTSATTPPPDEPAERRPGFGDHEAWLLGFDNLLGFMQQKLKVDDASITLENLGALPQLTGTRFSLHKMWSGGLTLGSQFAFSWQNPRHGDDALTTFYVGPRVGYIGSIPKAPFGYWLRGGPSVFTLASKDTGWSLALAGEANAVFRVGPTIAILFGIGLDIPIVGNYGRDNGSSVDFGYSSLGFGFGVMAEL